MKRVVLSLAAFGCFWPWSEVERDDRAIERRLLGPVAGLTASASWVRFDWLVREGRFEAAYEVAERALELDGTAAQGWLHYASHLAHVRGTSLFESDPEKRRQWTEAALDVLGRGEKLTHAPGDVAFSAGLLLMDVSRREADGDTLNWPGGSEAARLQAKMWIARAEEYGSDVWDFTGLTPDEVPPADHEHGE